MDYLFRKLGVRFLFILVSVAITIAAKAELSLQTRFKSKNDNLSVCGVVVDGEFVGSIISNNGVIYSCRDFPSNIKSINLVYDEFFNADDNAKDSRVAGERLKKLIEIVDPSVTFYSNIKGVKLWGEAFIGDGKKITIKTPEGVFFDKDKYLLFENELQLLDSAASENKFRFVSLNKLSNKIEIWYVYTSFDFREIANVEVYSYDLWKIKYRNNGNFPEK